MAGKTAGARADRRAALFALIALLIAASSVLYVYSRTYAKSSRLGVEMTGEAFCGIMGRALPALAGMAAASVMISMMSLVFQTMTETRVLTPSIIGFDSLFVGTQTFLVFAFGSSSAAFANPYLNYAISSCVMILVSAAMYGFILRKSRNNLVFLLMFGLVISGVLRNGSAYLQVIMSADDYYQVQAASNVTVNGMNAGIVRHAVPLMALIAAAMAARRRVYDVMSLGRDTAKSLGVHYDREININLMLIAAGMSVTTALIGSLTFLGLLGVNIAREIFRTHRHLHLFIGSSMISALVLISGQSAVELLEGAVPVTAVIDMIGCSYMFFLILKENRVLYA
ncbi:MAG: iron chelate uptake ABC transporter family permease subunit [Synergistaceae bacterium]|jgi:iron complex transport system permease protein|nr:iron chelate uptake ABC transporter family permease subunit [Synergistaceae bacterium]